MSNNWTRSLYIVDDIFAIRMNIKLLMFTAQLSEDSACIKVVTSELTLENCIGFYKQKLRELIDPLCSPLSSL